MAPFTSNGASRVASARTSRAGSTARDIMKKRDKPYKTEKQKVFAKKRKLDLHTSYQQGLPPGYIFLQVGTPELADRCKELSRQRGLPVNVVNAKPVSKNAHDPNKVSFHIARVGYHFKAEVVDQAAEELGYIFHRGQFVKEADLAAKRQAAAQQSQFAATLARYGVDSDLFKQNALKETPDQVRAAIKELFPRIPDHDLSEIVRHAWEEGTARVGTMEHLDLPRRVQLATIARIRHEYTDYDRLLRAFEWKDARSLVEPVCLRKLIEWRGENEDVDAAADDQFEEIVRETIVIDSDDEAANASEADDEDSVTELEPGDTSDTSIEITHQVAADDLGAESNDERSKRFLDRFRPRHREVDPRTALLKRKIETARQHLRNGLPAQQPLPPQQAYIPPQQQQPQPPASVQNIGRVVQPDQYGRYPEEIIIVNGQRMRVVRDDNAQPSPSQHLPLPQPQQYHPPQMSFSAAHTRPPANGEYTTIASPFARAPPVNGSHVQALHDRPIASIERDDGLAVPSSSRVVVNGARPFTPDEDHRGKRWRANEPVATQLPHSYQQAQGSQGRARAPPARPEVINLLSPEPDRRGTRMNPLALDGTFDYGGGPSPSTRYGIAAMHSRPLNAPPPYASTPTSRSEALRDPLPYDPSQPIFATNGPQRQPEQAMPARYQHGHPPANQVAHVAAYYGDNNAAMYGNGNVGQAPPGPSQEQLALLAQQYVYGGQAHGLPYPAAQHPVHGAPAPVQQAPMAQAPFVQPRGPDGAAGPAFANPGAYAEVPPTPQFEPANAGPQPPPQAMPSAAGAVFTSPHFSGTANIIVPQPGAHVNLIQPQIGGTQQGACNNPIFNGPTNQHYHGLPLQQAEPPPMAPQPAPGYPRKRAYGEYVRGKEWDDEEWE